jgi:hypothetical protein
MTKPTKGHEVSIAAINGPESVVISGERHAIGLMSALLERQGIKSKKLTVSHAFHSLQADKPMVSGENPAQIVINPAEPAEFERLLSSDYNEARGIVYLSGLEQTLSPQEHATTTSAHLLHLVQALAKGRLQTRLWLVTRGTQAVLAKNGHDMT